MNRANLILGTGWYRKKVLYIQLGADIVGSIAYSYEEGGFRELKGDFTRADARLDISSLVSPKINLAFQKQIIGLILFRLDSPSKEYLAHMEDVAMEEKFCFAYKDVRQRQTEKRDRTKKVTTTRYRK
eukprot:TRINITY_DN9863_c1_g1_i5.p1 TRINITY_DN9863_c1_g1~~TRINITY_DN9863_c1_g1_i5.p1  ORF type:complete len:128 (-),score=14.34 TRINITY_DN9863_c1_g1_i5:147-530(-)